MIALTMASIANASKLNNFPFLYVEKTEVRTWSQMEYGNDESDMSTSDLSEQKVKLVDYESKLSKGNAYVKINISTISLLNVYPL